MDQADLNKDNIAQALLAGGVPQDQADAFTGLLDACEFARYSPDAGHEAMDAHYQEALKVISAIDSKMKHKPSVSRCCKINAFPLESIGQTVPRTCISFIDPQGLLTVLQNTPPGRNLQTF